MFNTSSSSSGPYNFFNKKNLNLPIYMKKEVKTNSEKSSTSSEGYYYFYQKMLILSESWLSKIDISDKMIKHENFGSESETIKSDSETIKIVKRISPLVRHNIPAWRILSNSTVSSKNDSTFKSRWEESEQRFIQAGSGSFDEVQIISSSEELLISKDSKTLDLDISEKKYLSEDLELGDVSKETAEISVLDFSNFIDAIFSKNEPKALVELRKLKETKTKFESLILFLNTESSYLIDFAFDNDMPSIAKLLCFYPKYKYHDVFISYLVECIVLQNNAKAQLELSRLTKNKDSCETLKTLLKNECSYIIDLAKEKELRYLEKKLIHFRDIVIAEISEDKDIDKREFNDIDKFVYKEIRVNNRRTVAEVDAKIKKTERLTIEPIKK